MAEVAFHELIQRIRAGDAEAAAILVRQYEPEIRRAVRFRLGNSRLRRVFDSMDVCQSVLGSFFVRVAAGQFDLEEPNQLLRLLTVMAQNKLRNYANQQNALRRDQRRQLADGTPVLEGVPDRVSSPSQVIARRELWTVIHKELNAEERYVAEQRAAGRPWNELAAELGCTPEGLRKRYSRAVDRVVQRLGLDGISHA